MLNYETYILQKSTARICGAGNSARADELRLVLHLLSHSNWRWMNIPVVTIFLPAS